MKNTALLFGAIATIAATTIVSAQGNGRPSVRDLAAEIEDTTVAISDVAHSANLNFSTCVDVELQAAVASDLLRANVAFDARLEVGLDAIGNGAYAYGQADLYADLGFRIDAAVRVSAALCFNVPVVTVGGPAAFGAATDSSVGAVSFGADSKVTHVTAFSSVESQLEQLADEIRSQGLNVIGGVTDAVDALGMGPEQMVESVEFLGMIVDETLADPLSLVDPDNIDDRIRNMPLAGDFIDATESKIAQVIEDPCGILSAIDELQDVVDPVCDAISDGADIAERLISNIDLLDIIEGAINDGIAVSVQTLETLLAAINSVLGDIEDLANTINDNLPDLPDIDI